MWHCAHREVYPSDNDCSRLGNFAFARKNFPIVSSDVVASYLSSGTIITCALLSSLKASLKLSAKEAEFMQTVVRADFAPSVAGRWRHCHCATSL